jgi:hypothetical protein
MLLKMLFGLICAVGGTILPALAGDDGELVQFRTPSNNIHCQLSSDDGSIDCEIISVTVESPLPERPADCDLEWGKRFYMKEKGPSELICTGDTVRDHKATIVPYGENFAYGLFTCASTEKGLSCTNNDGHGFLLSKEKQELF